MSENVSYTLTLKDLLSGKIDDANKSVNRLEGSIGNVNSAIKKIGGIIAGAFVIDKIKDFIGASAEMYSEVEFAQSQLKAGLESTKNAAGISYDEMVQSAKKFSHELKFTQSQIENAQSVLLTFPAVTKGLFDRTTQAAMDMATRLKGDPKDSIIQLGKALQDPEKGIAALHRVGVNTEELKKKFETVTDTVERQKLILGELETEFGGSAKAAAEADVAFRRTKTIEEMRVKVGELTDKIEEALSPALEYLADITMKGVDKLTEAWQWLKDNFNFEEIATNLKTGINSIYNYIQPLFEPIKKLFQTIWGGIKKVWDALSQFSSEGAGIMDGLRDGLIFIIDIFAWLYEKTYNFIAGVIDVAHTIWVILQKLGIVWLIGKAFEVVWSVIKGIGSMLVWIYDHTLKPIFEAIEWAYNKIKSLVGIDAKKEIKGTVKIETTSTVPTQPGAVAAQIMPPGGVIPPKGKENQAGSLKQPSETKGATGQKVTTINITINKLIEQFKIQTTNMTEGSAKVKEKVAESIMSALRDSQITAGI